MNAIKTLTYPIVETFHSVQGEGAWTGVSAFFIRLAGCDVHCPWCDTKQSWNPQHHPQHCIEDLAKEAKTYNPAIVVITGGEPLMHNLNPLTEAIKKLGMRVHLETSGAHPFSGKFDWVTFSPKQFKPPHPSIYNEADELKVVVVNEYDLKWAEQQASLVSPQCYKYLQPEWNTSKSQELIFDYVLQHSQWRISLQTHKFLEIR
ncbi:MAG: 7-carboxy-7-deazaguanine synthase QueE [Xenococcaceae cyanobacterium MO_188.B29]|nr:7-carboxy-7-deazaguanine synthase QueE [Xenococcaceae cyanobacterium MO_188.B29]